MVAILNRARRFVSATSRVIGRVTAGAGLDEELTLSQVLDMVGAAAQGDLLYRDSSAWGRLGAGTAGLFLQTQGAAANPTWTAARPIVPATTFYVRTNGSDSNNGQANTAGGAWLTLTKACAYLATVDLNGQNVVVNVADGTYTAGIRVTAPWTGAGSVTFQGNTTTPANCIISVTGGDCVFLDSFATLNLLGFKLQTTTSGNAIEVNDYSQLFITGLMEYGACVGGHITAASGSAILISANYTISGATALAHIYLDTSARIRYGVNTVTITGTPNLTIFVRASSLCGVFIISGVTTFSGSATGQRYNGALNSVINTGGGGATYFPGGTAGAVATGAQYV